MDPKYSMWISTDPALGDYIPKVPINEEAKKHNQNLPGMGGVFNHINGDLYAYAGNNPVKYTDPDGNSFFLVTGGIGAGIGAIYGAVKSYKDTGSIDWKEVGKDALIGGAIGLGAGAATSLLLTGSATASTGTVIASAKAAVTAAFGAGGTVAVAAEKAYGDLSKAAEYGIQTYSRLRDSIAGKGLQAHHIIEQRFLPALERLGLKANQMLSVAVTPEEHQQFTNKWRAAFAYGIDYTKITAEQIWEKAQEIYANYPELLQAAKETLFGN